MGYKTRSTPDDHPVFSMLFSRIYPLYVAKAEKKNRTQSEVDQIITWLTGYKSPQAQAQTDIDMRGFIVDAPRLHPARQKITGVVCGIRVEEVTHPLMKELRLLDKLIDELARGKSMDNILRK